MIVYQAVSIKRKLRTADSDCCPGVMQTADYRLFKYVSCYFHDRVPATVNRVIQANRSENLHSGWIEYHSG